MKILKLKINNFGKLNNKEIELKDGINIIYGKNESGKSTLLKFIIGMFYGLSKNKNGKPISDYEKYTPWKEGEFSGKIKYALDDGKEYEVFREFKKKNPVIYNENLEDISKKFNIDKSTGNKFFHDQTKVDEDLFTSTIVSLQEELKLEEKEQQVLIQKMSNLASTGEDNVSYQKIINKLNKRQMEEIGSSRSQDRPINVVTKRLQEIQNQKEYLSNFTNKQYEMEGKKDELQLQIKDDENKLELLKELQEVKQDQELEKEKLKINQNAIKEYKEKIKILEKAKEKHKNEKAKTEKTKPNKGKVLITLCVITLIILSILIFVVKNDLITAIGVVTSLLILVYTGYTHNKEKIEDNISEDKQNVENIKIKNEIEVLSNTTRKLEIQIEKETKQMEKEYKNETERLRNKYIGIIPIKLIDEILSKDVLIYDINAVQNKINSEKINLHRNDVDMNNILPQMENLSALEEENSQLEAEYQELMKKDELINMAKTEIEKAYETMKNNVTPKFTKNLSQIIEKISQGKYRNVRLDEEKGLIVEVENGNYIKAENLSIGTIDQLYLSLRLGAGKEISGESLPIILDEAFAYWDEERLQNIIQYLNEEFKDRQIILFTCTNREKDIIQKLKYEYNYIDISIA